MDVIVYQGEIDKYRKYVKYQYVILYNIIFINVKKEKNRQVGINFLKFFLDFRLDVYLVVCFIGCFEFRLFFRVIMLLFFGNFCLIIYYLEVFFFSKLVLLVLFDVNFQRENFKFVLDKYFKIYFFI